MNRTLIAIALSAMTATSAIAGGAKYHETAVFPPATQPAPMMSGYDWTGGYVGAHLGFGTISYRNFSAQSGGAAGLFAGYRVDMGAHVAGIEGEISPATLGNYNIPTGDRMKLGAALYTTYGFKVTEDERTLVSVKAGPSLAQTSSGGSTNTALGLSAGVDIDHMITDNIILRGGVRAGYTHRLGSQDLRATSVGAGVGVGFKF